MQTLHSASKKWKITKTKCTNLNGVKKHISTFFRFSLPTKTWEVSTNDLEENKWQRVDLSWDPDSGLVMYIDNEKVASTNSPTTHSPKRITDYTVRKLDKV